MLSRTRLDEQSPVAFDRPPSDEERWYVVQTIARREAGVLMHLEAQRFRAFLPQMTRTIRHARKLRTVRAAVFPGYLFVSLDLQRDRWRSINGTVGAAGLIMGRELPLPVPRGIVESFLDYVDDTGVCRFDRDLVQGQKVRVIAGPFADTIGQLVRLDANGRVRVLLEIMGGVVPTTLERSALEAI